MIGRVICPPPEDTAERLLEATKQALLDVGYAGLSTRRIAAAAEVPLSQIHYHFGSKGQLVLALLDMENRRRLARQRAMYGADEPLWKQWEQACDYLDDDIASGYVRMLQEMTAAGWSDADLAAAVRADLVGWFDVLTDVAARFEERTGGLAPLEPRQLATLVGAAFLGAESLILLGFSEAQIPCRSALRTIGAVIRSVEEAGG